MTNQNSHKQNKEKSLPAPNFNSLVVSIASVAILKLGLEPNKKDEKDLVLARHNIDLLKMLKEKTKNNLSEDEEKLLHTCTTDLQCHFVSVQNQDKEN